MSDNTMDVSLPIYTSIFPTIYTTHGYNIYSSSTTSPASILVDKNKKTYWISDINTFNSNGDYIGTSNFNGIEGEYIGMDCDFSSVIDSIAFTFMLSRVDLSSIRVFASNDKETWDELQTQNDVEDTVRIINPSFKMYKKYIFILSKSLASSSDYSTQICINEIKILLKVYKDTYHNYFNKNKLFEYLLL